MKGVPAAILGKVCETITYGVTASADFSSKEGPKLLRITDLTREGVSWETVPHCRGKLGAKSTSLLQNGDIVVARTGGTVGKSYIIEFATTCRKRLISSAPSAKPFIH